MNILFQLLWYNHDPGTAVGIEGSESRVMLYQVFVIRGCVARAKETNTHKKQTAMRRNESIMDGQLVLYLGTCDLARANQDTDGLATQLSC